MISKEFPPGDTHPFRVMEALLPDGCPSNWSPSGASEVSKMCNDHWPEYPHRGMQEKRVMSEIAPEYLASKAEAMEILESLDLRKLEALCDDGKLDGYLYQGDPLWHGYKDPPREVVELILYHEEGGK